MSKERFTLEGTVPISLKENPLYYRELLVLWAKAGRPCAQGSMGSALGFAERVERKFRDCNGYSEL